ncbi:MULTISPECIES: hypothetical protein [unclassified Nocardioides]|uniref:hypothetical protein n=1 Tax=unclassified Nocardioides TaxID=2615069 RepID=UPI0006FF9BC4|nr:MULTISPECIES: hypothetical protein [unclassified Nocardioides]KQY63985.1 hypothetical protein ASD30_03135 [Nocardioides sp. Root140]KRF15998.1 hypothetical protein ASH02_05140 [Nocardioides sp. Soil796]
MSSPLPQSRVRVQRIAEAAVERARLSVVPRLRTRTPRVPFVTLVSLLLVAGVVGLLMFNTNMQQNSFAATDLEQQASELTAREQGLQMELEELRAPQRLAEEAQRYGMVPAMNPAFIKLQDGKVIGNPIPASAADAYDVRPPEARKPKALDPDPVIIKVKRKTAAERRAEAKRNNGSGRNDSSTTSQGDGSTR